MATASSGRAVILEGKNSAGGAATTRGGDISHSSLKNSKEKKKQTYTKLRRGNAAEAKQKKNKQKTSEAVSWSLHLNFR